MKRIRINTPGNILKLFTGLFVFFFVSTGGTIAQKCDTVSPKVHIEVHRKCDKNGNIVEYDSSYYYSWSSEGNSMINDSAGKEFERYFGFFNFPDNDFFADSFKIPDIQSFPEFSPYNFFRFNDSTFSWNHHPDSVFRDDFFDYLFKWNFSPLAPGDSTLFNQAPFKHGLPDSYFEDLDKYIDEVRKNFERDFRELQLEHDTIPHKYYKYQYYDKPGKKHKSVEI